MGPLELVIVLLLVGLPLALVVMAVVLIARRANTRPCPRCGARVKQGVMLCGACGFDFSTIGAPPSHPVQ